MLRLTRCWCCFYRVLNTSTGFKTDIFHRKWLSTFLILHRKRADDILSTLFVPVPVKPNSDDINVGTELTGTLNKSNLAKLLNQFQQHPDVKIILTENELDNNLQHKVFVSFRQYCLNEKNLPVDLHIIISDILQGAGNVTDILPYFIKYAREMFPHLECMDDLKKISDLRCPANWYPEARKHIRKVIFHAGPTNSGKTYHALERFISSRSGIYCGPLKLLATEVFKKTNERGTACDLVTGEERKYAVSENEPSSHISCTVEMASLNHRYEVAVIDEIQMMRDYSRGWAWTRALLGINAEEVHVCGELGAVDLIKSILTTTNEKCEVFQYNRLTELQIEDQALCSLDNVMDGDCIVCFNKNDVYSVSTGIERRGKEVAVIYGALPPNTKLAQAQKFNDSKSSCKVLVATDAIGMGLNLSIRRMVFYSLVKPIINKNGEQEMDIISVSQALQIAGRAGRFGTSFEKGYVTTFRPEDLNTLKKLLSQTPELIDKAGLHPTAEQIELYAYHLPHSTLSNLIDIFVTLSTMDDSLYFMCAIDNFKFLSDMIQHIPLQLRARYVFCCAPINLKMPFVCTLFRKYAKQYSLSEPITVAWIRQNIGWPLRPPRNVSELVHLEAVFDVLDLYLWFSYRFSDIFVDPNPVREIQSELDVIIQQGVLQITRLLKNMDRLPAVQTEEPDLSLIDDENTNEKERTIGKGILTERLLAQGLLTQDMLRELQKEWIESNAGNQGNRNNSGQNEFSNTSSAECSNSSNSPPPSRKLKPRKKS